MAIQARPMAYLSKPALRTCVLGIDNACIRTISGDSLELMIPKRYLKLAQLDVLERDARLHIALPSSIRSRHGNRKLGELYVPPKPLRGVYARAARFVAETGDIAAEVMHNEVIDETLMYEWDFDAPRTVWEGARDGVFQVAQGSWRPMQAPSGDAIWVP